MQKDYIDSLLAKLNDDSRLMTLDELRHLKSVFDSFEGRLYIEEKFISVIESPPDQPYDYDFDTLYAKIEKQIKSRSRDLTPLRNRALRITAVLLPLMLMGGIALYLMRDMPFDADNTIARIEDKVRLSLPDGSMIVLDPAVGDIRISEQKDVVLVSENGSLIIERTTNAGETRETFYGNVDVPRGTRFDMVLEDGTHVWLNSDSRLRFPPVFNGSERRVYLEGEAYFEVAHNANKPFIVETRGQKLTVLGTAFNISAYRDEQVTYTTLSEGSVALRSGGSEVVLRPGEQARLNEGEATFTTENVNLQSVIPWKNGVFIFEGKTLEQVMRQLARWYDMEYSFEGDETKSMVLRGIMPVQTEISSIFEILETSGRVKFRTENNRVTIKSLSKFY